MTIFVYEKKKTDLDTLKDVIIDAIREKQGNNITSINLQNLNNSFADMFIITDAKTNKQVEAISDFIERQTRKVLKDKPFSTEGQTDYNWVILDYINIVVHVFTSEKRDFYKIETLWGDGIIEKY